uniref:Uncharacterized protein n=1 Tax=viral metagenome TaxID=1070528 RepID=A0A6M3JAY7_9ZZZZ
MTLKELHTKIEEILTLSPSYGNRVVLFWRGKKPNGDDAFGQAREIISCTLKMATGLTENCIVLSPILDFSDWKVPEDSYA